MSIMRETYVQLLKTLGILLAVIVFFTFPATVQAADDYPTKPIRLIVPFAAGGGTDFVARAIAPGLSERLGQPVIVDNRGGAGAILGTTIAAKAAPDGYTLLVCDTAHSIQPTLRKLEYDPIKSFSLIALLVKGDSMLCVPASLPANNIQEFIALAKKKPGELKAGTAGLGSSGHMALELLRVMGNIDIVMVHYRGAGASLTDLLGGYVDISNITIQAALPHIKAGRIKALGVGGPQRSEIVPDVPTVAEQGLPGYSTTGWRGLLGPAGIPAPIVNRLTGEIKTILATDKVKMYFKNRGMETSYKDPHDFAVFISDEISRLTDVVRKGNIKLQRK